MENYDPMDIDYTDDSSVRGGAGFSFGYASSVFSFGGSVPSRPTSSATTGFSFGNNVASRPTSSATTGFSFGNNVASRPTSSATTGFSFGNNVASRPTSSATTGFSFGNNVASRPTSSATTGFSFGNNVASRPTSSATTGFSFGNNVASRPTSSATTGFSFGDSVASRPNGYASTGFSFGGSLSANGSVDYMFRYYTPVPVTLTNKALNNMKDLKYNEMFKQVKLEQDDKCTICQENLLENIHDHMYNILPCKHVFHSNCIKEYLQNYSYKCPTCKKDCGEHVAKT